MREKQCFLETSDLLHEREIMKRMTSRNNKVKKKKRLVSQPEFILTKVIFTQNVNQPTYTSFVIIVMFMVLTILSIS